MRSKSRFTTLVLLETREIRSVCNRSVREDTTVSRHGARNVRLGSCVTSVARPHGNAQLYDEMRLRQQPLGPRDAASQIARVQLCGFQMLRHTAVSDTRHVDRARLYSSFHLIEQPIDAFWSAGATPVVAIARMASTSSRGAPARGGVVRPSSSRPRYLRLRSAL